MYVSVTPFTELHQKLLSVDNKWPGMPFAFERSYILSAGCRVRLCRAVSGVRYHYRCCSQASQSASSSDFDEGLRRANHVKVQNLTSCLASRSPVGWRGCHLVRCDDGQRQQHLHPSAKSCDPEENDPCRNGVRGHLGLTWFWCWRHRDCEQWHLCRGNLLQ